MTDLSSFLKNTRIGFHYFPDTLHYRDSDLKTWLPRLQSLGASWLVLQSPPDGEIPAEFLQGLAQNDISPVVQFKLDPGGAPLAENLEKVLACYARSGTIAVQFFDRPNSQASWSPQGWAQSGLVERFVNRFYSLAGTAVRQGLVAILPPLEPGGSYWDTTFFRAMLESLIRRKDDELLQRLILGSYAWTFGKTLNWGAGGSSRWPEARPYRGHPSSQDQRGFRAFDWYQEIARTRLGKPLPVMLFQAGLRQDPLANFPSTSSSQEADILLAVGKLLADEPARDPGSDSIPLAPLPREVIAGFFWLLSATSFSPSLSQAWFLQDGAHSPLVDPWLQWMGEKLKFKKPDPTSPSRSDTNILPPDPGVASLPIAHYLLLSPSVFEDLDLRLDLRNYIHKHHPTIGFSPSEAALAARVTILGSEQDYPETLIRQFRKNGALVERIDILAQ